MSKRKKPTYGDAIASARKACERLETDTPACAVCGEDRPTILERHHIAGRKYDPATMILCKNHHALITDTQKDFPPNTDSPSELECIGRMLINLAELFRMLVEKLKEFGTYLIEMAQSGKVGS